MYRNKATARAYAKAKARAFAFAARATKSAKTTTTTPKKTNTPPRPPGHTTTNSAQQISSIITTLTGVTSSLTDALVMTFFYETFLPAFLRTWYHLPLTQVGCMIVLAKAAVDSAPRIQLFFSLSFSSSPFSSPFTLPQRLGYFSGLVVSLLALHLEVFCLAAFAAMGSPACEYVLVACFVASSVARMAYWFVNGSPGRRGLERLGAPVMGMGVGR